MIKIIYHKFRIWTLGFPIREAVLQGFTLNSQSNLLSRNYLALIVTDWQKTVFVNPVCLNVIKAQTSFLLISLTVQLIQTAPHSYASSNRGEACRTANHKYAFKYPHHVLRFVSEWECDFTYPNTLTKHTGLFSLLTDFLYIWGHLWTLKSEIWVFQRPPTSIWRHLDRTRALRTLPLNVFWSAYV